MEFNREEHKQAAIEHLTKEARTAVDYLIKARDDLIRYLEQELQKNVSQQRESLQRRSAEFKELSPETAEAQINLLTNVTARNISLFEQNARRSIEVIRSNHKQKVQDVIANVNRRIKAIDPVAELLSEILVTAGLQQEADDKQPKLTQSEKNKLIDKKIGLEWARSRAKAHEKALNTPEADELIDEELNEIGKRIAAQERKEKK